MCGSSFDYFSINTQLPSKLTPLMDHTTKKTEFCNLVLQQKEGGGAWFVQRKQDNNGFESSEEW